MQPSSAPERIWLQDAGDYSAAFNLEVTWCVNPIDDADTEYIRADLALSRGDALAKAEAENAQWRTWGVIEIMTRNPNVDSFVREKEERIATLEAEITKMARDRDDIVSEIARLRMILAARDAYDRGEPSTPPVTGKPKRALGGDDA